MEMRRSFFVTAGIYALLYCVPGGALPCTTLAAGNTASASCDRACLDSFVDQYLAALVARDPAKLPLAKNVKYTENGQPLNLGDGMWGVANGLGEYKLYAADPQAGQVMFMGVIRENDHPQITALRLKIEKGKISEIEAIIARNGGPNSQGKPEGLVDKPIFSEVLPPSDRRPREEMISIANSYFEGLNQVTGKITPFDSNCTRVENGNITANNPNGRGMQKLSCGAQFDTGFSSFIKVREGVDRRFPVVDEERGLVYTVIFFDHPGTVREVKETDGTILHVPPPYDTPYTFLLGELFKIQNGKIMRAEAVLLAVPYRMPGVWANEKWSKFSSH
jgi:hypothetical protein